MSFVYNLEVIQPHDLRVPFLLEDKGDIKLFNSGNIPYGDIIRG